MADSTRKLRFAPFTTRSRLRRQPKTSIETGAHRRVLATL
jgi:hypothetical protein